MDAYIWSTFIRMFLAMGLCCVALGACGALCATKGCDWVPVKVSVSWKH